MPSVQTLWNQFVSYLNTLFNGFFNRIVVALVIILIGFIIGRLSGRLVGKLLHEFELDALLKKAGVKMPIEHTIAALLSSLIYFVAIIIALNHIGLTTTALYIVVGAVVLLVIIATVLGIKDFIPNMIAGIFIYRKALFHEGQTLLVKNIEGRVKKISIVETELETESGDIIYIPNSLLVKSTLIVKKKAA